MDAAIADTLNRLDAGRLALRLDALDQETFGPALALRNPWYRSPIADTLMGDNDTDNADRAWLVGAMAHGTPGVRFDGEPADGDWDNLFSHIRAAILARRDQAPCVRAAIAGSDGVGSR